MKRDRFYERIYPMIKFSGYDIRFYIHTYRRMLLDNAFNSENSVRIVNPYHNTVEMMNRTEYVTAT